MSFWKQLPPKPKTEGKTSIINILFVRKQDILFVVNTLQQAIGYTYIKFSGSKMGSMFA